MLNGPIQHTPYFPPGDVLRVPFRTRFLFVSSAGAFFPVKDICFRNPGMPIFDQHFFDDILDFFNGRILIGSILSFQDFHNLIAQALSDLSVPASN